MDKIHTLVVRKKRIAVTQDVYKAYYQAYERERYAKKKALDAERSLDCFSENGVSAEYQYAMSRPSLEDQVLHRQALDNLAAALAALSESERTLIDTLFFKGQSCRQVSRETGIPRQTLNSRKHRILQKLKTLLEN